jgi:hypothetical protein
MGDKKDNAHRHLPAHQWTGRSMEKVLSAMDLPEMLLNRVLILRL